MMLPNENKRAIMVVEHPATAAKKNRLRHI
jgi:hypothetical protein